MDYSDKKTEAELIDLEKKLNRIYKQAWNEMREETEQYFEHFAERYQKEYQKYKAGEYTEAQFKAWYQAQVARGKTWEARRDSLAMKMTHTNEIAAAYINNTTPSIFALNANYMEYMIEQDYDVSFTLVNEDVVKNLVMENSNAIEFKTVKVNPVRDYKWNSDRIQSALISGILQGKSIGDIADSFMVVQERNKNAAIRNARTSVTSAQNAGRIDTMRHSKDMGINIRKQWLSAQDNRVRDSHAVLNGQIRDIEDTFDNDLLYPADPNGIPAEVYNCRCTLKYIYPKYQNIQSSERYSEGKQGNESYQEWLKRKNKDEQAMATSVVKDSIYYKTKPSKVTIQQKQSLIEYANSKGVTIRTLRKFDGDIELLRSGIDTISDLKQRYPTSKTILAIKGFDDDKTYAETKGHTIYINNLALRNRKITEKSFGKKELAAEKVEDIFIHEYGHIFYNEHRKNVVDTFKEAYYNVNRESISDKGMISYLRKRVSNYSIDIYEYRKKLGYWEVPSELLVKAEHGDLLGIEFFNLLKR